MNPTVSEAARLLGSRIRGERLRFAISQMELAELSAVHFTNLGRIERGQANPSLHTIVRIAGALNLDPSVLVAGLSPDLVPEPAHRVTVADLIRAREAQDDAAS